MLAREAYREVVETVRRCRVDDDGARSWCGDVWIVVAV